MGHHEHYFPNGRGALFCHFTHADIPKTCHLLNIHLLAKGFFRRAHHKEYSMKK